MKVTLPEPLRIDSVSLENSMGIYGHLHNISIYPEPRRNGDVPIMARGDELSKLFADSAALSPRIRPMSFVEWFALQRYAAESDDSSSTRKYVREMFERDYTMAYLGLGELDITDDALTLHHFIHHGSSGLSAVVQRPQVNGWVGIEEFLADTQGANLFRSATGVRSLDAIRKGLNFVQGGRNGKVWFPPENVRGKGIISTRYAKSEGEPVFIVSFHGPMTQNLYRTHETIGEYIPR